MRLNVVKIHVLGKIRRLDSKIETTRVSPHWCDADTEYFLLVSWIYTVFSVLPVFVLL